MSEKENVTLVADALANGPEAFGPIVDRYKDLVFGVALVRLRNFHDAEDLTQETFVEAYQRLGSLKEPQRLGGWLRAIVTNRCINHINRRIRNDNMVVSFNGIRSTPDDEATRLDVQTQVLEAIQQLGKALRESVTLYYIGGYTIQEIADIQRVPEGTIKRRLHDARQKLKEDMIEMVSDTLKEHAPKEEFNERVYNLLYRYPSRTHFPNHPTLKPIVAELKNIGASGIEGYKKAMTTPHWPTRAWTMKMLWSLSSEQPDEEVKNLFIEAIRDSNRRVRHFAAGGLIRMAGNDLEKCKDLAPRIFPLILSDRSNHIRRYVARLLGCYPNWTAVVPVEIAGKAVLEAPNEKTRKWMAYLMKRVLSVSKQETVT